MSMTFTKLFTSITESTVWCESDQTRLVWITMLAMADRKGRVFGSVPGLAHRARVSLEATITALDVLMSPDAFSRTKDHDGRRIEEIGEGGWVLLNHAKYRAIQDEETIKETKRKYIQGRREREREQRQAVDKNVYSRPPSIQAEAEAEALKDISLPLRVKDKSDPLDQTQEEEESFEPEKPKKMGYQVPPCPYEKITEAYAKHLPSLPQLAVISPTRKRAMQARWREVCTEDKMTKDEATDFFQEFFSDVAKSRFLMGRLSPSKDGRTFKADFDWLMKPTNFAKVFEGRYHERSAA